MRQPFAYQTLRMQQLTKPTSKTTLKTTSQWHWVMLTSQTVTSLKVNTVAATSMVSKELLILKTYIFITQAQLKVMVMAFSVNIV